MADFKIQRGQTTFADTELTATITAGTDYTAPSATSAAFIRIVNVHHSGLGAAGDAGPENDDISVFISNPGNLTTSITFERPASGGDNEVWWEIVEYVGAGGGGNEFIVRDEGVVTVTDGSLTATGTAVAGIAADAAVAVTVTGVGESTGSSNRADFFLTTSDWDSANDQPTFARGGAGGADWDVSYAVVEFTGANWADVQRVEHTMASDGVIETETLGTTLGDTAKTLTHPQVRTDAGNIDNSHIEIWLSSTTEVSFQVESGADVGTQVIVGVAWVIENTQSGGTTDMNVQRISGTRGASNGVEDTWTETIPASVPVGTSSIWGEATRSSGGGNANTRGQIGMEIDEVSDPSTTVNLIAKEGGQTQNYRLEVVEWPEESAGGTTKTLSLSDSLDLSDTGIGLQLKGPAFSDQLDLSDVVSLGGTRFVGQSDTLALSDSLTISIAGVVVTVQLSDQTDLVDVLKVPRITRIQF